LSSASKLAEPLFALPQRHIRHDLFGDVGMGTDQTNGFSALVALDRGLDGNPARFAVAGPNNAVLHRVVAHLARDGVAEFFLGGFAILGMDALHPVFVRFVCRIRRQPVNQQILRRAAIAETGPEIDLEAADPPQLLHARELGLAFAQRDGSKMLLGHVAANDQHAADAIIFVDRAKTVGPVDLLQLAVTRDRNELVLMPRRAPAAHHLLDLRTDNVPDFGPALPSPLAKRARVALGSHGLAIGVVIELDEIGTPPDEHRVVGIEQNPHRGAQALRPGLGLSGRTARPVIGPRQRAHLPAAGEKVRRSRSVDLQHEGSVASSAQITSRNLAACHNPIKLPTPPPGSKLFFVRRNKMAFGRATAVSGPTQPHFMRPAAVSARVMTAPTSIARRRD
jgi:hypothetical protein